MKNYKCTHTFKAHSEMYFYNGEQVTQSEYVVLRSDEKGYFREIIDEDEVAETGFIGFNIPSDYSDDNSTVDFSSSDSSSDNSDVGSGDFGGGDMGGGGSDGDW